jgi:HlyD family secretion protein
MAVTTAPAPRSARGMVWIIGSMFAAILVAMGLIEVDRVVTAQGRVISQAATLMVQPLDASIVRSIDVHEGEHVKAGQVLAQLDPTFASGGPGSAGFFTQITAADFNQIESCQSARKNDPGPPMFSLKAVLWHASSIFSMLESFVNRKPTLRAPELM